MTGGIGDIIGIGIMGDGVLECARQGRRTWKRDKGHRHRGAIRDFGPHRKMSHWAPPAQATPKWAMGIDQETHQLHLLGLTPSKGNNN
ncbi:hypothetical protein SRHO_G00226890 [Serrasalmus rhombeus]